MKRGFIIALLMLPILGIGQKPTEGSQTYFIENSEYEFDFFKTKFYTFEHNIKYRDSLPILIDGEIFFGTDFSIPKSKLTKANFCLKESNGSKICIPLDVSNMYDPWFKSEPIIKVFKDGDRYIIRGSFSDGAGSYYAEWIVTNNASIRTILTNDQQIFIEYFNSLKQ
jgi:hypothetical protein